MDRTRTRPQPSGSLLRKWIEGVGFFFLSAVQSLMRMVSAGMEKVGAAFVLLAGISARFPQVRKNPALTLQQMMRIGVTSLPLIIVISFFIGAVATISADYQFRGYIPDVYLGTAVAKFVIIESGPVLTALVLAGRVGSAIAAEIGTMKEKEELDAMAVLDLDPLRYLAMPRLLAGIICFPVLVIISDFLALVGGWLVAYGLLDVTTATYVYGLRFLFSLYDVGVSLGKAVIFGIIVILMGYYHGLRAGGGARGVGQASMRSVVSSSVLILVMDFFIVYFAY